MMQAKQTQTDRCTFQDGVGTQAGTDRVGRGVQDLSYYAGLSGCIFNRPPKNNRVRYRGALGGC